MSVSAMVEALRCVMNDGWDDEGFDAAEFANIGIELMAVSPDDDVIVGMRPDKLAAALCTSLRDDADAVVLTRDELERVLHDQVCSGVHEALSPLCMAPTWAKRIREAVA